MQHEFIHLHINSIIDTYEEKLSMLEVYRELAISEEQFRDGKFRDAKEALSDIRKKHKL